MGREESYFTDFLIVSRCYQQEIQCHWLKLKYVYFFSFRIVSLVQFQHNRIMN